MNTFNNFLLESTISISILSGFYLLFLRFEPKLLVKRIILVSILIFSIGLPFVNFELPTREIQRDAVVDNFVVLENINVYNHQLKQEVSNGLSASSIFLWIYIFGIVALAVRLLIGLGKIWRLKLQGEKFKRGNLKFIYHEGDYSPFSFFNTIFINRKLEEDESVDEILRHELTHVKQWHSLDVLLVEGIIIFQWFNPLAWLLKKMIVENNEHLADREVIKTGFSINQYRKLLLEQAIGARLELANSFSNSQINHRFKMLKTMKTSKFFNLKTALGALVLASVAVFFACENEQDSTIVDQLKTSALSEDVFIVVEDMPEFPGGNDSLRRYLINSIRYPVAAQEKGIEGKIFVSFVVTSIGEIDSVKVLRGVDPNLDKEAMRIISEMPDWKPGKQRGKNVNVQYTIPINFMLEDLGNGRGKGGVIVLDDAAVNQKQILYSLSYKENRAEGTVWDSNRNPLSGASVIIKGSNRGTITDKQGNFVLETEDGDEDILLSFVGMKTMQIPLKENWEQDNLKKASDNKR